MIETITKLSRDKLDPTRVHRKILRLRHVELSEYDRKQIRDEAAERTRNG